MIDSDKRIQYIIEYLSRYICKIDMSKKAGLFDNSVLFELFAIEVCKLWFNKGFRNLNINNSSYPIADLVSDDDTIVVQVTTQRDIPSKVRKTLNDIAFSKDPLFHNIEGMYFFCISYESEKKVKPFIGDDRIGNIDFDPAEHLISTDKIIGRAKTDIVFQRSLFSCLSHEEEQMLEISSKLENLFLTSRDQISMIDSMINGEYIIDRSELINKAKSSSSRFIMVSGEAGAGKTAFCKDLLADEERVIYARAEQFAEAKSLNDIFDIDLRKALTYLGNTTVYFYIDALEFISDSPDSKKDILYEFFSIAYQLVSPRIIVSCRTTDRSAFHHLEAKFGMSVVDIPEISSTELYSISRKYQIIKQLLEIPSYSGLLGNPFYIDLIVRNVQSLSDIKDINSLSELIWKKVMCLEELNLQGGISHSDLEVVIGDIALTRAKEFTSGVRSNRFNERIVSILKSHGVVIEFSEKLRLRHDIFEDVFFERYLDNLFEECRGDYSRFYASFENIGKCIYRRYQLWVENKLFAAPSREKYLYKILITDSISAQWRRLTIIGILNSRYCIDFFNDYREYILSNEIENFLDIINIHSFYAEIRPFEYSTFFTNIKPQGAGRASLIKLIYEKKIYEKSNLTRKITKLCNDYSQSSNFDEETAIAASSILQYYVEQEIERLSKSDSFYDNIINNYLNGIYNLSKYSSKWIDSFWKQLADSYINKTELYSISLKIIRYTLRQPTVNLITYKGKELCDLANIYLFETGKSVNGDFDSQLKFLSQRANDLGIVSNAADFYESEYNNPDNNIFYILLLQNHFFDALDWAIGVLNKVTEYIYSKEHSYFSEIELQYRDETRRYKGNNRWWMAGTENIIIHPLIDDLTYLTRVYTHRMLKSISTIEDPALLQKIADLIKDRIMTNSNNVMMLSVIAYIGNHMRDELPGFAIDLAESVDIVIWDTQRVKCISPNELRNSYQQEIYRTIGIPFLRKRYSITPEDYTSLSEYIVYNQLNGSSDLQDRIISLLDKLYLKYPDCEQNASYDLAIQAMDLRKAKVQILNNDEVIITPALTGSALNIVEAEGNSAARKEKNRAEKLIESIFSLIEKNKNNKLCYADKKAFIQKIEELRSIFLSSIVPGGYDKALIAFISYALLNIDFDTNDRSNLCNIWMDGIDKIRNNGAFLFDHGLIFALYGQVNQHIDSNTSVRLNKLILSLLVYTGSHGTIIEFKKMLTLYLKGNPDVSERWFSVLAGCSDTTRYMSERDEMLVDYVLSLNLEKRLNESFIDSFDPQKYDLRILVALSCCGMSITNKAYCAVIKKSFEYSLVIQRDAWSFHKDNRFESHLALSLVHSIEHLLISEICDPTASQNVAEILFKSSELELLSEENFRIYDNVLNHLLSSYFDSFKDSEKRSNLKKIIQLMENQIDQIEESKVYKRLSFSLAFSFPFFPEINWNDYQTSYSYLDKQFLCDLWMKYGADHLADFVNTVYAMHIKDLLPEVILPLSNAIIKTSENTDEFAENEISNSQFRIIMNLIITTSYMTHQDAIKNDAQLSDAFESMLECMVNQHFSEAAVILNDFRIH